VSPAEHFADLKRFVRFGPDDETALRALLAHARPHFSAIAREFYERVREHEQAHAVFESEEQIARLHTSLCAWLERVLTGPYDLAYADKSRQIGFVHVRVGLPQRYVFSAMTLFRLRLEAVAQQALGASALPVLGALARVLDLELALMNEAYLEAAVAHAERLEREHERLLLGSREATERRLVRAVGLAPAVFIGLDPSGAIQLFNREAERLTGYDSSELLGRPIAETLLDGDDALLAAALGSAEREASGPLLVPVRTRTGKRRTLGVEVSHVPAEGPDEAMVLIVGRDVTGEQAVTERLRQSERLASLGTLAAGLAHEIRNPLNGALLHLTFLERALKREKDDGDVTEAVDVVAGEIRRLSNLVSEFLEFARPSEIRRKPVHIQELCRHVASLVKVDAERVRLELALPDSPIVAAVDAEKIEQVLLNLVHNGIDAVLAAGSGRVVLGAAREPRAVVIEIRDDGAGIATPDAPIFDAFYTTKPGGTGLGLAIAHRIVTDHEGTLGFESAPGRTTFRVRLPLGAPAGSVEGPAASEPTP
jgi:PAS domain S-box-containing protein